MIIFYSKIYKKSISITMYMLINKSKVQKFYPKTSAVYFEYQLSNVRICSNIRVFEQGFLGNFEYSNMTKILSNFSNMFEYLWKIPNIFEYYSKVSIGKIISIINCYSLNLGVFLTPINLLNVQIAYFCHNYHFQLRINPISNIFS